MSGGRKQAATAWQTVFRMSASGGQKAVFTTAAAAQEWCRGKRGVKVSVGQRRVKVAAEQRLEAAQ